MFTHHSFIQRPPLKTICHPRSQQRRQSTISGEIDQKIQQNFRYSRFLSSPYKKITSSFSEYMKSKSKDLRSSSHSISKVKFIQKCETTLQLSIRPETEINSKDSIIFSDQLPTQSKKSLIFIKSSHKKLSFVNKNHSFQSKNYKRDKSQMQSKPSIITFTQRFHHVGIEDTAHTYRMLRMKRLKKGLNAHQQRVQHVKTEGQDDDHGDFFIFRSLRQPSQIHQSPQINGVFQQASIPSKQSPVNHLTNLQVAQISMRNFRLSCFDKRCDEKLSNGVKLVALRQNH